MSEKDNLPDPIKSLAEAIEKKGAKVQFGLKQQGHIETIEKHLAKYDSHRMRYNTQVWNDIGKEIGWCPLTAALWYFRHLDNSEEAKREKLKDLYDECTPGEQEKFNKMYGSVYDINNDRLNWAIQQCERTLESPHHVTKRKIEERNDKIDGLTD